MYEVQWAPRISMDTIRRLYAGDAAGMRDTDLLMEVGWALCARSDSIIKVNRAHEENIASCPICESDAPLRNDAYGCACGWTMDRAAYHLTYKKKQLTGITVVPVAKKFLEDWTAARDDENARMRAIDFLLHRFHWELEGRPSRPVAINYIDGKIDEIFALLNDLAHAGTPEWERQKKIWEENLKKSDKIWRGRFF